MNQTSKTLWLALLVWLSVAPVTNAASFNCAFAKSPVEVAICNDEELGSLDIQMARLYFTLKNKLPDRQSRQLKLEQRQFINARNRCGFDEECITNHYNSWISVLEQLQENYGD